MKEYITLNTLCPGQRAVVEELFAAGEMGRRLQELGLVKGTEVGCLGAGPLGDPVAYDIRGAVIALRGEDARGVRVSL